MRLGSKLVCVCCSNNQPDHFIPFKYPSNLGTYYTKNFDKSVLSNGLNIKPDKFAYNRDKKVFFSKEIPMDVQTSNKVLPLVSLPFDIELLRAFPGEG